MAEGNGNERGERNLFIKQLGQLKGPVVTEEPQDEVRHYCKIHACTNFHPTEKHKI